MPAVIDCLGPPPSALPPSTLVRRWDTALLAGAFGFTAALLACGWALWHPLPGFPDVPDGGLLHQLAAYPHLLLSAGPRALSTWADNPAAGQVPITALHIRMLPAWIAGLVSGGWLGARGLRPHSLTGHVSGPRLLQDKEAKTAALQIAEQDRSGGKHGFMKLHPLLDLPKRRFAKHVLAYGGVGSGKTQITMAVVAQIIRERLKAFVLDTKGDYVSRFPEACILSPFDRRSRYWDIAADVRTAAQADAFAASIIPDDNGPNRYFTVSAQLILAGCIRALIASRGTNWTWLDLDTLLSASAAQLAPLLAEHHRKAHPIVSGPESSTASVMATLAAFTQTISQLAAAFGDGRRSDGSPRKRLSLVAWAKDEYTGKKAIIALAGPDPGLTQRFLAAVINVLVPVIISPALPDDVSEDGRAIFFVLDELGAAGKLMLAPLIDKGRSKGVCCILGFQDQAQIAEIYGDNFQKGLAAMVGTHIVCQLQMGETRDQVASLIGSRRVSIHTAPTATGPGTVHEEMRQLVQPNELTTMLGFRKGKKYGPAGFGIRAIANLGGEDLLLLDWPGIVLPERRPAFVPAKWTLPAAARPSGKVAARAVGDGDRPTNGPAVTAEPERELLSQVIAEVAPKL
jgi:type IV secretory pathway TraG/TraD family ATPase VirD4